MIAQKALQDGDIKSTEDLAVKLAQFAHAAVPAWMHLPRAKALCA